MGRGKPRTIINGLYQRPLFIRKGPDMLKRVEKVTKGLSR